jgi:hypothetical protein
MKDNTFGWNRRLFIGGAAGVTLASFYLAAVARGALKACNYEDGDSVLSSDLQSLIRIGNSYLNELTENGELDALGEVLLDETQTRSAKIVHTFQRPLSTISRQVRDEFARGETVICDGWVLAKSEARFCAMIAARAGRLHVG